MTNKLFITLIVVVISSCVSSNHGRKLATFTFNDKNRNSYIVDRFPDYGDGHKDGCIVMSEISLQINRTNKTSLKGKVSDADNKTPLHDVNIFVYYKASLHPLGLTTNSNGEFNFKKTDDVTKIEIHALGYRDLTIDFSEYRLL